MKTALDQFGVTEKKGIPVVSSRYVAEIFKKRHADVLRTVVNKIENSENDHVATQFCTANFTESKYKDRGKQYQEYLMTRDGFSFIAMSFTGKEADRFKMDYINRFNQMESFIKNLKTAKLEFPDFTDAIMDSQSEPKHYHFSNEINMINKIVLGMNAKQFRELHGIEKGTSIRPYLTNEQIKSIENLQRFDIGLIAMMEYEERKRTLMKYHEHISVKRIQKGA
jgi:Rha family phage regulatory protein